MEYRQKFFVFAAYPAEPVVIPRLFSKGEGSAWELLENPPIIRPYGWSLETLDCPKIIKGEHLRVVNGDAKVIDLYEDGTLVFRASSDRDHFLAFSDYHRENGVRVNSMALCEVAYNFAHFYRLLLEKIKPVPKAFHLRVEGRNLRANDELLYLVPGAFNTVGWVSGRNSKDAPEDSFSFERSYELVSGTCDVGAVACDIVERIFIWFGLEPERVPYCSVEGDIRRIDPEKIRKIGGG